MQVRDAADYRTLFWAFVLFPLVPAIEYSRPGWGVFTSLLPATLYLSFTAGVFVHNHNHRAVFTGKKANFAYGLWLSVFYGFPIFSWIPTHNRNHHRHLNGEGDVTRTWRRSRENTLLNALTFPFFSSYWQAGILRRFVARERARSPRSFMAIIAQTAAVVLSHAALFVVAVQMHGLRLGATAYAFAFGAPALMAPWTMMFINYVQHVGCDPASPHDHSRNFVSPTWNFFAFNAGFHTVHHENPGVHWSRYPELHARRAPEIAPALNEHTIEGFCFKTYVLGAVLPRFRVHQIGEPPWQSQVSSP